MTSLQAFASQAASQKGPEYAELSSLKPWDAVVQCAVDAGALSASQGKQLRSLPWEDDFSEFIAPTHPLVLSADEMKQVAPGAFLGFIDVDSPDESQRGMDPPMGRRHLVHAMISLGDGLAVGANNGSLGINEPKGWSVVDLAKHLNWTPATNGYDAINAVPLGIRKTRLLRLRYRMCQTMPGVNPPALTPQMTALFAPRVVEFNQLEHEAARSSENPVAAQMGACHNLSIFWLSLVTGAQGTATTPQLRVAALSRVHGADSLALTRVFAGRWINSATFDEAEASLLTIRELEPAPPRSNSIDSRYLPFDRAVLLAQIQSPVEGALLYSFAFNGRVPQASGGAHTIAFFRETQPRGGSLVPSDTMVRCFDPAYGEFAINEADFPAWFENLQLAYGPFTHHRIRAVRPLRR